MLLTNVDPGVKGPGCSLATKHLEALRERNSLSHIWPATKIVDDRSGLIHVMKLSIRVLIVPKYVELT